MWLKCCQCGRRFEIVGEDAKNARAFYDSRENHPPDKEGGVCDECFETAKRGQIKNDCP